MENIKKKFREINSFHLTSFLAWSFLKKFWPIVQSHFLILFFLQLYKNSSAFSFRKRFKKSNNTHWFF